MPAASRQGLRKKRDWNQGVAGFQEKLDEMEVDRFEKSFFRHELCIRGNTLSEKEISNYLATKKTPAEVGDILTQMEVGEERRR